MPSCCSWISLVRPLSLLPTRVLSFGWLKSLISLTSTRNSPVNTLVSIGDSEVRLLPLSQVKSAKAKGSGAFGLIDTGALEVMVGGLTTTGSGWVRRRACTNVAGDSWPAVLAGTAAAAAPILTGAGSAPTLTGAGGRAAWDCAF